MSARQRLREGTQAAHDRVDAMFGRLDLGTSAGYADFLVAQARAHLPVEDALEAAGIAAIVSDWAERRRGDALRRDLADLGTAAPAPLPITAITGEPAMLGALYVLEGSRLGGAVLKGGVAPGAPVRFIGAKAGPGAWRRLVEMLDERLTDDGRIAGAMCCARYVFSLFEMAGRVEREFSER